jgi:hypothetical protein
MSLWLVASSAPTKLCLDVVQSHNQILHYFGDLCVLQCAVLPSGFTIGLGA